MLLSLVQLRSDYKAVYRTNWKVAQKLEVLIETSKIELSYEGETSQAGKRVKISSILRGTKITLRTLQRWKDAYRSKGICGLASKKKGCKAAIDLLPHIQKQIEFYRSTYRWGSEVIQAHLLKDKEISVTRYKIERYLSRSGLKLKYPCTTIKKVRAKKKKHTKKVLVHHPGEHTQMDVKYQTHLLLNKQKAYVYNFVDHASNWSFKKAYSTFSAKNTKDFVEELLDECPFTIKRLQTDNGIEFTFKWTSKNADDPKEHPLLKICSRENIRHVLIPPGEKELQGLVERSHRQDDQELFSRIDPMDLEEFNRLLTGYWKFRNRGRRFKKLKWESPDAWLEGYLVRFWSAILHIKGKTEDVEKLVA